jgi:hypothetical protein
MIDEDDMYILKAHIRQLYKDIANIDFQLSDLHPKHNFPIRQTLDDFWVRITNKKKTQYEINLEKQKDDKSRELEKVIERFKSLGGDITSISNPDNPRQKSKTRRKRRA